MPEPLTALLCGFVIALVTTPVGVSGAVFLLPIQLDLLKVPNPSVTPTNLLYNVGARWSHLAPERALRLLLGAVATTVAMTYVVLAPR